MNSAAPMETIKALTGMAYATAAVGNSVTPSTRPMAAPKLAAADRPSVKAVSYTHLIAAITMPMAWSATHSSLAPRPLVTQMPRAWAAATSIFS